MGRRGAHAARHRAVPRRSEAQAAVPAAAPARPGQPTAFGTAATAGRAEVLRLPGARLAATAGPATAGPATAGPVTSGPVTSGPVTPGPVPPRAGGRGPAGGSGSGRKARKGSRGRRARAVALVCVAGAMVALGLMGSAPPGQAVALTVKRFLLAWDTGHYSDAAALTTGARRDDVAAALQVAYSQLGAADLQLTMASVKIDGTTATAAFNASVDLGRGGPPWQYVGGFRLRETGSSWLIVWTPAVIVPGLKAGDRFAVVSTMPPRAQPLDSAGNSLIPASTAYVIGVIPAQVTSPLATATALANLTGLSADALEMRTRIQAAPSGDFLGLLTLDLADYARLSAELGRIQGLTVQPAQERVFGSLAPAVTGTVGTETSRELVTSGAPYVPGVTVGASGLERAYQSRLVGSPTTRVVIQGPDGHVLRVLRSWPGTAGQPVRTTIDPAVQQAAQSAVGGSATSAAIVAIRPGGGQILAVAQQDAAGQPPVDTLAGRYSPGQAFTIVSAAALLEGKVGLDTPADCQPQNSVGGVAFTNVPAPATGIGSSPTFAADFTHACDTGIVGLTLNPLMRDLPATAKQFGIGQHWTLPLASFSGSIGDTSSQGAIAADSIGTGTVAVSPLTMALAAGAIQSGTWHPPSLVVTAGAAVAARQSVDGQVTAALQSLMRTSVTDGAASGANVAGKAVSGQVGSAPLAGHPGLYAIWFVGYVHDVAFAAVVFSPSSSFAPAAQLAARFAAGLPG